MHLTATPYFMTSDDNIHVWGGLLWWLVLVAGAIVMVCLDAVPQGKEIFFEFGSATPVTLAGTVQSLQQYTDSATTSLDDKLEPMIVAARAGATQDANAHTDSQISTLHAAVNVRSDCCGKLCVCDQKRHDCVGTACRRRHLGQ